MKWSYLANPRVMAVLLLSFSSGLPLALTGATLQAWYTMAGVNIMTIGALTLVGQPYVYKFLWAPIMDRFTPMKLGRRRSWIFLMQLALVFGLVAMAFLHPKHDPWLLAVVALAVAFFSASQDIAINAYTTDVLRPPERGNGAAMSTLGYRVGMLVSGALALIFAAEIGWKATYLIMAGLMALSMLTSRFSPRPEFQAAPPTNLTKAVIEPWKEFLTRQHAVLLLVFIVIYKLCDAFALSLNTYFLLHGVGFSLVEVGSVSKLTLLFGSLIGSVAGGVLLPRFGMYRSLFYFGFFANGFKSGVYFINCCG